MGYYIDNIYDTTRPINLDIENRYIQFKDKNIEGYDPLYKYVLLNEEDKNKLNSDNNVKTTYNNGTSICYSRSGDSASSINPNNVLLVDDVTYPDTINELPVIGSWLDKRQIDENFSKKIYEKKLNKARNDIIYQYTKNDNVIIFRNIHSNYQDEYIKKIKIIFSNDIIINRIYLDLDESEIIENFDIINYITQQNIDISSDNKDIDKLKKIK